MKLNHECVRDLLLSIESLPKGTVWHTIPHLIEHTSLSSEKYSLEEIAYTATCLLEAGFIIAKPNYREPEYYEVQRLTWNGHQFLDNIRDPEIWKQTKSAVSKVAGLSLSVFADVSKSILYKVLGLS